MRPGRTPVRPYQWRVSIQDETEPIPAFSRLVCENRWPGKAFPRSDCILIISKARCIKRRKEKDLAAQHPGDYEDAPWVPASRRD